MLRHIDIPMSPEDDVIFYEQMPRIDGIPRIPLCPARCNGATSFELLNEGLRQILASVDSTAVSLPSERLLSSLAELLKTIPVLRHRIKELENILTIHRP